MEKLIKVLKEDFARNTENRAIYKQFEMKRDRVDE